MEPLTIIGTVSNLVQLVDAATKAVEACHQIWKLGASVEDLQIAYTSDKLGRCCCALDESLAVNPSLPHSKSGIDLEELSTKCRQCAQDLHDELKSLQKSPRGGRREALTKYLQTKRKAKELESPKKKLDEYRKILDTLILVDIRSIVTALPSQQNVQKVSIDQHLSNLAEDLASCNISAAANLKTEIDRAIEANKHELEQTSIRIESHIDGVFHTYTRTQAHQSELQKQYEQLLGSLRFEDINTRQNDVSEPNPRTFHWIFDDTLEYSWDSYGAWLERGQGIYWINGKAGSGKSTLMKFIINDQRTLQKLKIWSDGKDCLILTFYFWLSGSKLQRTQIGLLCSLNRQILMHNRDIAQKACGNYRLSEKRTVGDWSLSELRSLFYSLVQMANAQNNVCLFLDGIDEFDRSDDVQNVLDLMTHLSVNSNVKLCVSSRPEDYLEKQLSQCDKLRLQDLTAQDMKTYVRDSLDHALRKYKPSRVEVQDLEYIVRRISHKAEGVFLWVHYAFKSILTGIRNEDDAGVLLERLEELQSGMEQLYHQMWSRLNGDETRYREEASLYFSFSDYFPLPLFELMVAVDEDTRSLYLSELRPQEVREVIKKCEVLKARILTRCAGLLEVEIDIAEDEYENPRDFRPPKNIRNNFGDGEPERSQDEDRGRLSAILYSAMGESDLIRFKVGFLHRTAKDFMLKTKAGQSIAGQPVALHEEQFGNIIKARMASMLQNLEPFGWLYSMRITGDIGSSETHYEIELLKDFRRVYEACSVPGLEERDINRIGSWKDRTPQNFLTMAAWGGCFQYLKYYLNHECADMSSYYKGSLFLRAVSTPRLFKSSQQIALAGWLVEQGADLCTPQWGFCIMTPYEALLHEIVEEPIFDKGWPRVEMATQTAQFIEKIATIGLRPLYKCFVNKLLKGPITTIRSRLQSRRKVGVVVEMSMSCLQRMALCRLATLGAQVGGTKMSPVKQNTALRILAFETNEKDRFVGDCMRVGLEDSIYLGQVYEKVIFPEDYPQTTVDSSLKEFYIRLDEVFPRCEEVDRIQWEYQIGRRVKRDPNARILDPTEEVNESNWREKNGLVPPDWEKEK